MYESNLIIKFSKNLFNFVCRAVAARPGHNVSTRGYDHQSRDLGSQGPLAYPFLYQAILYPHIIPRGEGVISTPPPLSHQPKCKILYKRKILQGIRDTFQGLRKSKVSRKSFVWLSWQLFDNMVLFTNNCQNVYENEVIFKCFQKPQISKCQNETLCNDSSILLLFKK